MSKRKSSPTKRKEYSQYYTEESLGKLLINTIPLEYTKNLKSAIDLCAGEGSLLLACKQKFSDIETIGFDIDKNNIELLKSSGINAFHVDSSTEDIERKFNVSNTNFCLSLGNPPFKNISVNTHIENLFKIYGLYLKSNKIRSENYFLLFSLHLLKEDGVAAFIVPESIISGEKNKLFREVICENFNILETKEMITKIFLGTEAKTFIMVISKQKSNSKITLTHYKEKNKRIQITSEEFIKRGDYKYYKNAESIKRTSRIKIKILRGKSLGKDEKVEPSHFLHTTSFKDKVTYFNNQSDTSHLNCLTTARQGDIITPRVGSRSLGKIGIILGGSYQISDCLFIIRTNSEKDRNEIVRFLSSQNGSSFFSAVSRGVGAKYITIKDMQLLTEYI